MTDWKSKQNHDGGWAYSRGCSWTEPTVFALLAQSAADRRAQQSCTEGLKFLRSMAGPDGGFRPQPGVTESTWVTSVVALLPREALGERQYDGAIEWLKGQTGRESGWRYRLQQRFAGSRDEFPDGWPWYPGAAAWVIPTSLGILAFQKARQPGLQARIDAGRDFLLSRMCADGGWNHGSSKALGREGDSYPETTGIALFALRGVKSVQIERAKAAARAHLATCRNAEGSAWLRMAMAVHGEPVQEGVQTPARTTLDLALLEIASADRNPLL